MSDTPGDASWPEALDMGALLATGWQPTPFREFVLKIHSRCDLACDYCYMYTMSDQSWRSMPVRMPLEIVDFAIERIAEHCRTNTLSRAHIILHGGEPLLAGAELLARLTTRLVMALPPFTVPVISMQTNGLHLTTRKSRIARQPWNSNWNQPGRDLG